MTKKLHLLRIYPLLFILLFIHTACTEKKKLKEEKLNYHTFCFYYNWYGSEKMDGKPAHWAHPVLKWGPGDTITKGFIPGGDNISSNFFPQLGPYSSCDPKIIRKHMEMIRKARIGVIVITWWNNDDIGKKSVPLILDEAAKKDIKVCFHIEPFKGRNAITTRKTMRYLVQKFGKHSAFYRLKNKPIFFVYDSYLTPAEEWQTLLHKNGKNSIRNAAEDAWMIGLWVGEGDSTFFEQSGFDGFYTYFGATGFTHGSTPKNWPKLQKWADQHQLLFIPSVSPGYIDSRVRPWNTVNTRERQNGKYYDNMFRSAIQSKVKYIGITSFNEWHEGTQIEPAKPFRSAAFHYQNYGKLSPDFYLKRTAYWLRKWEERTKPSETDK